jgi:WhiB family transcriptional regulator, redox-sensing transcriptional regulator
VSIINLRRFQWEDLALCAETDPALFYPGQGESDEPARALCRTCDVRTECLTFALEHPGYDVGGYGVWSGTSPEERTVLLRKFGGDIPAAVSYAHDAVNAAGLARDAAAEAARLARLAKETQHRAAMRAAITAHTARKTKTRIAALAAEGGFT